MCGRRGQCDVHHIFEGTANRRISEQEGLKIYLCRDCHHNLHCNNSPEWEHIRKHLKAESEATWIVEYEENHPEKNIFEVVDEFRRLFGKSYL